MINEVHHQHGDADVGRRPQADLHIVVDALPSFGRANDGVHHSRQILLGELLVHRESLELLLKLSGMSDRAGRT
jgi:hypothetical protein